ncbi:hypothetical protein RI367_006166 [Sorochytrium milnesiophthora]
MPSQQLAVADSQPLLDTSGGQAEPADQYVYWVGRPGADSERDYDEDSDILEHHKACCGGLRQLLRQRWRRILAVLLCVAATALGLILFSRPRLKLFLDGQTDIDLRATRQMRMEMQSFTDGYIRFVVDASLPPYVVRVQEQIYRDARVDVSPLHLQTYFHLSDPNEAPLSSREGCIFMGDVVPQTGFSGQQSRVRYQATVHLPRSAALSPLHKRDGVNSLTINITSENLDFEWDVQNTDRISSILLHSENGNINGRLSAQQVDIHSTNGDVDLAVSLATPRVDVSDNVRVTTSSGDVSLALSILGADDRPHKRDLGIAAPLRVQAHSGNGNVRATYTVPAVSSDPHHFKDNFHADFVLHAKRGASVVAADTTDSRISNNERLSPDTVVRFADTECGWVFRGNVTAGKLDDGPGAFGSRVDINLTTVHGDVALHVR